MNTQLPGGYLVNNYANIRRSSKGNVMSLARYIGSEFKQGNRVSGRWGRGVDAGWCSRRIARQIRLLKQCGRRGRETFGWQAGCCILNSSKRARGSPARLNVGESDTDSTGGPPKVERQPLHGGHRGWIERNALKVEEPDVSGPCSRSGFVLSV